MKIPKVDRDELIIGAEAARMLDINPRTFRAYVIRGQAPQPDIIDPASGHPRWKRGTIIDYRKTRPGQGARVDLATKGSTP